MTICITGTPCTGKTSLSKMLAGKLGFKRIDIMKLIKEKKLHNSYDRESKCYVVDTRKLSSALSKIVEKNKETIIDSHLSHYLHPKYVELCIVTKCELRILRKRLEKRKYGKKKVMENLESEIFDICLNEAKEMGHMVFVIDTTKGIKNRAMDRLLGALNEARTRGRRT
ncbi:adenylate kinase family protein [Candidatus Woesearchaeota archaeon]|nr:adenylate kinase family protein [Candidatus Woesearchaeota archaeon]